MVSLKLSKVYVKCAPSITAEDIFIHFFNTNKKLYNGKTSGVSLILVLAAT